MPRLPPVPHSGSVAPRIPSPRKERKVAHAEHKDIARQSLLMKALPAQHVETLLSKALWKTYARGETLFLQDEEAQALHIVLDGWVKLYRMTPSGNEAVVSVFTRGESFGEAVALRNRPYPVSAEATTKASVMHIPSNVLTELIRHDAEVGLTILSSTFSHLHALVSQLEQLKAQTGVQRMAEFLLDLSPCDSGACEVVLPYDKSLIAGKLGMKPESLSRAFAKLKAQGVTINRNHALIDDVGALKAFVDDQS